MVRHIKPFIMTMILFNSSSVFNLFGLVYLMLSLVHTDSCILYSHSVFTIYQYKKPLFPLPPLALFCCKFYIPSSQCCFFVFLSLDIEHLVDCLSFSWKMVHFIGSSVRLSAGTYLFAPKMDIRCTLGQSESSPHVGNWD